MMNVIEFLIRAYEFDLSVLSNPWMYLPALIPVLIYIPFMILKWWLLTCPIWVPIVTITGKLFVFKYDVTKSTSAKRNNE